MELIYLVVLFVMIMVDLATLKIGGWLVPMIFGMFSLAFTAYSLGYTTDIPFSPYPQLLLGITGTLVCLYAATRARGEY